MKKEMYLQHVFLILLISVLLTGCGFKDIDKRFFAVSVGVDPAKNTSKKYLVSLKFAVPSGSRDQPSQMEIVTQEADSISEAVRIIKTKVDKEIDFSHCKVILFGEKLVKEPGNAGLNYWFTRRRDLQEIAWVAIAKPTAMDVLKVKPKDEQLPSNAMFLALGRDGSETPYVLSEYLFDFKFRLIEKGIDPVLPIIQAKKNNLEINTVGLFNKSIVKQRLNSEETKILNFIRNEEEKSALWAQKGKVKFIVNTEKVKTKYRIYTPKGKRPYIKMTINVTGNLEESNRKITNSQLSIYEKALEKQLNKDVKQLLVKIHKAGVDPIGFGLRYRSRSFNDQDWEQWKRIYPQIEFKINSKVQITDTGLIE
ncbi:Ger(x)C family spore germination protein [Neobacillus sp. LXY-1]|uniref:Ger(x)C family spore germination protein n=1 Tax=Neobacillus sp. LXY-1 TaxID=3379133 RepID=UPI003EE0644A